MGIIGWIRLGDKAACGGIVVEGEARVSHEGIPFAFEGARLACRFNCTIAQAYAHYTLPNGKNAPHHGHMTSRGCPLISTANGVCGVGTGSADAAPAQFIEHEDGGWQQKPDHAEHEHRYLLRDEQSGEPLANVRYKITLASGAVVQGRTDAQGQTEALASEAGSIEAPYHGE
jgi:uncharacterized Zn-binding protein involved in type VI secretion